jgi:hypothetical protein
MNGFGSSRDLFRGNRLGLNVVLLRPAYGISIDRTSICDSRINDWSWSAVDGYGSAV